MQLNAGVRLVTAQAQNNNGAIHLCHSSCGLLDAGPLSTWLAEIKSWMDANPHDVVTILLVNSDDFTAAQLHQQFVAAKLSSYGYVPPQNTAAIETWPTLQTLITSNKRLVTFVADMNPADTKAAGAPYLLNEFSFVFENPYQVTSATNFTCTPDRPTEVHGQLTKAISSGRLSLVNHFLDLQEPFGIVVPDIANVKLTNSQTGIGALGVHAKDCAQKFGKQPNFLLVDFFDQGPAINTVDTMNGITPVGRVAQTAMTNVQKSLGSGAESRYSMLSHLLLGSPLGAVVAMGMVSQVVMASL